MMKWALGLAGVKDLSRPADKLSVSQNFALGLTGMIWVRCVGTDELLLCDHTSELPTRGCQLLCWFDGLHPALPYCTVRLC